MDPSEEITAIALELFRTFLKHVLVDRPPPHWDNDVHVREIWANLNPGERKGWLAVADQAQTVGVH